MRAEDNPLDLNNFPDDLSRDGGGSVFEPGSSSSAGPPGCTSRSRKKNGKDDCDKVYECRFCSLKFCKSQALGGHMNRHRQERETEAMNRARQMVFGTDNIATVPHLSCQQLTNIGDTSLPFRSVYHHQPSRLYLGASSSSAASIPQQPPAPTAYLYPSPSHIASSYSSQYHSPIPHHSVNDYCMGHVLTNGANGTHNNYGSTGSMPDSNSNYTCIGTPVQDPTRNRFQDHHGF